MSSHTKRPKKKTHTKRPRLLRATDAKGKHFAVGQRVRYDDAVWVVDSLHEVEQDGGQVEIVYFRKKSDQHVLAQIHTLLVTILDDGASRKKPKSIRQRLTRKRR